MTDGEQRSVRHKDRLTVAVDGQVIEVFNWVNATQPAVVRGGNPCVEKFEASIGAGDMDRTPDAVTAWVADELDWAFGIDPEDHGIDIIDVESDEVDIL